MKAGYCSKNQSGLKAIHYAAQGGQINFAKWLADERKQDIAAKIAKGVWQYILQLYVVR